VTIIRQLLEDPEIGLKPYLERELEERILIELKECQSEIIVERERVIEGANPDYGVPATTEQVYSLRVIQGVSIIIIKTLDNSQDIAGLGEIQNSLDKLIFQWSKIRKEQNIILEEIKGFTGSFSATAPSAAEFKINRNFELKYKTEI